MLKVRIMKENGTEVDYEIGSMETLAKCQSHITEEAVKSIQPELSDEQKKKIFIDYLRECDDDFSMRDDLVEEITNNMYHTCEDIAARLLADTDYDTIDEMTDAIESRDNALYDIYNIAREYV